LFWFCQCRLVSRRRARVARSGCFRAASRLLTTQIQRVRIPPSPLRFLEGFAFFGRPVAKVWQKSRTAQQAARKRREDVAEAIPNGLRLADIALGVAKLRCPARCIMRSGSSPRIASHVIPVALRS
jgi:hypothetical protein